MSGWEQALDHQLELWRFWNSKAGANYARGYAADTKRKGHDEETVRLMGSMHELEKAKMLVAEPIYIADEFVDVIEAAAETFEPEALLPTDLITETGFAYFPRSLSMPDVYGKTINFRAIGWMPMYQSKDNSIVAPSVFPGDTAVTARERWMMSKDWDLERVGTIMSIYCHTDDPDDYGVMPIRGGCHLSLGHLNPWAFGIEPENMDYMLPTSDDDDELKSDLSPAGAKLLWSYAQVTWRLLSQRIAHATVERPSRPVRRRAEREGITPDKVTVIRLRRPKGEPTGETRDVEWSHRWLVGAHWRNQWYPSLGEHRQIWIGTHVKGPPEKELVIRPKRAFELVH